MEIAVVPTEAATVAEAQDQVTAALRSRRGLRPGRGRTTSPWSARTGCWTAFNKITSGFFVVMIALSSVGLMVGGVGVVAIMMISVTERTREIGVRKALGATRRRDHVPVPGRGGDADAGRLPDRHGRWAAGGLGDPLVHPDPGARCRSCRSSRRWSAVDPDRACCSASTRPTRRPGSIRWRR